MRDIFGVQATGYGGMVKRYFPCPIWEKGAPWKGIDRRVAGMCAEQAEAYLGWQPRVITASDFMRFSETGDRVLFEKEFFKRRSALGSMLVAECVEAQGRFVRKLADMAWMLCEESYWGLPATRPVNKEDNDPLPDETRPELELFVCETGNLMSYLLYIMGAAFDRISPMLRTRIQREIQKRIIAPFLGRDDFTWMGLGGATGELWEYSNWTPWCYSNCLSALLLVEESEEKRLLGVKKVLRGLGNFLEGYREDGGCDEGCGYWSRAAGSVFDCLELLYAASGGAINIYDAPIIRKMGEYIVDCYVGNGYFVNFADASARVIPEAELVHRYGARIGSTQMRALGKEFIDTYLKERYYVISQSPMRLIPAIRNYGTVKANGAKIIPGTEKYYKTTQVCMVRTADNWFFAAKGGHNNETHNHNDVGSFVLYYRNTPVFIDAGVEAYSGKTFGKHRYELWTMQSDYHNVPKINGISQSPGGAYRAEGCGCCGGRFVCDIQHAYAPEAGVKRWNRDIYEADGSIFIEEAFVFAWESHYEIMFMTPVKPELQDGTVKLGAVEMLYDGGVLAADVDIIELTDEKLRRIWGTLYRLRFSNVQDTAGSKVVFQIKSI